MRFSFSFLPKGEKFFDLFEQGASNIVDTAKAFQELVEKWDNIDARVQDIHDLEHKGDEITHRIMANLHSTFFTPLDREDIAALAQSMDDVVDFIQAATEAMHLYAVEAPTSSALELANVIVHAAMEIAQAMPNLRHRNTLRLLHNHCVEINRLENEADRIHRKVLGELFTDKACMDIIDIIKWREIYEHMESATDRCEDVANVLEGVALKHA